MVWLQELKVGRDARMQDATEWMDKHEGWNSYVDDLKLSGKGMQTIYDRFN